MRGFWVEFTRIVSGILNELTDHNAYMRHLQAHGVPDSPEEWRKFQDEHWQEKSRRARCC
jgi:hypothetical protein